MDEPTFAQKPGTCRVCTRPIATGERIYPWKAKRHGLVWIHSACVGRVAGRPIEKPRKPRSSSKSSNVLVSRAEGFDRDAEGRLRPVGEVTIEGEQPAYNGKDIRRIVGRRQGSIPFVAWRGEQDFTR